MKKIFFFSILFFSLAIVTISFIAKKETTPVKIKTKPIAVECPVYYDYDPNIKAFVPASPSTGPVIRKNANAISFSTSERALFKSAVTIMKGLPLSNKTSWQYQAAIHGTTMMTGPGGGPMPTVWNTCKLAHNTCFFLAWHRVYLYFFERILMSKMPAPPPGVIKPGLPYWDYQTYPMLPLIYRSPALATLNPLFDDRNPNYNAGSSLPPSINTDINTALSKTDYYLFQQAIEGPHGNIHLALGGGFPGANIGSFVHAAEDPLFWAHHANIDRLWEVWLNKGGGRCNPNATQDPDWWSKKFYFIDETGGTVSMTAGYIVQIASSLNYKYDIVATPPIPASCIRTYKNCPDIYGSTLRIIYSDYHIYQRISTLNFEQSDIKAYDSLLTVNKMGPLNITDDEKSDQVYLEFENIVIKKAPEGVIELYINPKNKKEFNPDDASYSGSLDLFTAAAINGHKSMEHGDKVLRININHVIKNLKLNLIDLKKAQLVFVVRGNYSNKGEILTTADVKLGKTAIAVYKNN